MLNLDNRKLISKSRRILIPLKPSEVSQLSLILDNIAPHLHPSCTLHLLGVCPSFLSGGDGELAYAYGLHQEAVLTAARTALIRFANDSGWHAKRLHAAVCESGSSHIVSVSRDYGSDLILLATSTWTQSLLARWKVARLRKSSNCPVLVLPQPQRPKNGWPISLDAMSRTFTTRAGLVSANK